MANAFFSTGLAALWTGGINFSGDNIKIVFVDHGTDTPNVSTDQYLSDIGAGARVATSGNLASKTVTNGTIDAADITLTAVTGATVESIVMYKDTGVAATSQLILYIDTGTNLPFTPNGGDATVQWHASGIASIS
jgi:hypothetical protein